jgi:phthalate 4,5-dioxygenase oxygenase subunit
MRCGHFTGILNFTQEDAVVSMSGGAIRDRSKEMLSTADLAIIGMYRALLSTARAGVEGADPLGLHAETMNIKGTFGTFAADADWHTLVSNHKIVSALTAG